MVQVQDQYCYETFRHYIKNSIINTYLKHFLKKCFPLQLCRNEPLNLQQLYYLLRGRFTHIFMHLYGAEALLSDSQDTHPVSALAPTGLKASLNTEYLS